MSWDDRPDEVKYLLNPAFCGRLLCATVGEYYKKTQRGFPYPLIYLILPLVLPRQIRVEINSRTSFTNWVQQHSELLFNFGERTKDLVEITNETVLFLMQTGCLELTDNGELCETKETRSINKSKYIDSEVKECLQKAGHVGRWFAMTGRIETIYTCLGVRP